MSRLFKSILKAVNEGSVKEPFTAQDVIHILKTSKPFLSKHSIDNPEQQTPYFERVERGKYKINPVYKT
jgi:hypothetical protein